MIVITPEKALEQAQTSKEKANEVSDVKRPWLGSRAYVVEQGIFARGSLSRLKK
jgi:hypothetical protein